MLIDYDVATSEADDMVFESDETFNVEFSSPTSGVTLGNASGSGAISDDDPAPDRIFAEGFEEPQP